MRHVAGRGSISDTLHLRAAIQNIAHVSSPAPSEIRALLLHRNLLPQQAEDLWTIAKKNEYMVDVPLTQAYLGYYAQRGDANAVKKGMDAMSQSGVVHNEKTYELLLRAHVATNNTVGLLKVFHQLSQENVVITDAGIHTIILSYFSKYPDLHAQIELFLALTISNPKPHYNLLYHILISKLVKGTDLNADNSLRVKHLMREMEIHGIVPLLSTFETLLHSDIVEFEHALEYFKQMRKHNLASAFAYAGLIHLNAQQGRIKECLRLWSEMLSLSLSPTPTAYNAIMQPLALAGSTRECAKMFDDMLLRGIRPSILTFTILAQAYIMEGNLARARTVLVDMNQHGVRADARLYHMLVSAHAEAGDSSQCIALISRAYGSGLDAGGLLGTLVGAYGDSDAKESHDALMRDLRAKGVMLSSEIKDAILRRQATVPMSFSFVNLEARSQRHAPSYASPPYSPPSVVPRLRTSPTPPPHPQPLQHPQPPHPHQHPPAQHPPPPQHIPLSQDNPATPASETYANMYTYPYPYYYYPPYYMYPPQSQQGEGSTVQAESPPTSPPPTSANEMNFTNIIPPEPTNDESSASSSDSHLSTSSDSIATPSSPDVSLSSSDQPPSSLESPLSSTLPVSSQEDNTSSPITNIITESHPSIPPNTTMENNSNTASSNPFIPISPSSTQRIQEQQNRPSISISPNASSLQPPNPNRTQSRSTQQYQKRNENNQNFENRPPRYQTNDSYPNPRPRSHYSSDSSSNSQAPINISRIQSNNSAIQRLKRRNERQEKLIMKLQSRYDLNSLILDKLQQPNDQINPDKLQQEITELERLKQIQQPPRVVTQKSTERLEKLKRHQQESRLEKRLQKEQEQIDKQEQLQLKQEQLQQLQLLQEQHALQEKLPEDNKDRPQPLETQEQKETDQQENNLQKDRNET